MRSHQRLALKIGFCIFIVGMRCVNVACATEYAFLVAVQDYPEGRFPAMSHARKDISSFWQMLIECGYLRENIVILHDGESKAEPKSNGPPTGAGIARALRAILQKTNENDTIVVAFIGNGVRPKPMMRFNTDELGLFCPLDAEPDDESTMISIGKFLGALENSPLKKDLVFVEACYNGRPLGLGLTTKPIAGVNNSFALFGCAPSGLANPRSIPFIRTVVESWWSDSDYFPVETLLARLKRKMGKETFKTFRIPPPDREDSWLLKTRSRPKYRLPVEGYALGPGDVLDVAVPGLMRSPDNRFTGASVVVPYDGKILMPYVGKIDVSGVSVKLALERIANAYEDQRMLLQEKTNSISVALRSIGRVDDIDVASRRIEVGDVLGIYIGGVLPGLQNYPPVFEGPWLGQEIDGWKYERLFHRGSQEERIPAGFGMPVTVIDDGSVSIPFVDDIQVRGRTIGSVEKELQSQLIKQKLLLPRMAGHTLLTLLKTKSVSRDFRLSEGDVIDLYVQGLIGKPTTFNFRMDSRPETRIPLWIGEPIVVAWDGSIRVPQLPRIQAKGKRLSELKHLIQQTFVSENILRASPTIMMSLGYVHRQTQVSLSAYRIRSGDQITIFNQAMIARLRAEVPSARGLLVLPSRTSVFPPAIGVRHHVDSDGYVAISPFGRIKLAGLLLGEAEQKISQAFVRESIATESGAETSISVVAPFSN